MDTLTAAEAEYLSNLPRGLPTLEWVQSELDRVWREFGLDNRRPLDSQPVGAYYVHPVWLMNGIFTAADPESQAHRQAIVAHAVGLRPSSVADFGGGFGELACLVSEQLPDARVSVVEPYAHEAEMRRLSSLPGVSYDSQLERPYDVLIAQDVLEHVERPVELAMELASAVRVGGVLILANNFYPVEECHLPRTFYLRHTFTLVMRALGLSYRGSVAGCSYAKVYAVGSKLRPGRARIVAGLSRVLAPIINVCLRLIPGRIRRAVANIAAKRVSR